MNSTLRRKIKRQEQKIDKIEHSGIPAGLARTRKFIQSAKSMEIQFMKLCSQIQLDNYKQSRSERQREDRRSKRHSA
jgi:hypothetical protein